MTGRGPLAALSLPASPQLPDEILPSSGQIGRVTRDEVIGCLAPFPFPASQEEHLGREGDRRVDGKRGWGEKGGG